MGLLQKDKAIPLREIKEKAEEYGCSEYMLLFPCDSNNHRPEYLVVSREVYDRDKSAWWQRLNVLWVTPVLWLTTPIKYVITGSPYYNSHSTAGRFITRLIGE